MPQENGGETEDRIAPVIPLFGGEPPAPTAPREPPAPVVEGESPAPVARREPPAPVVEGESPAPVARREPPAPVARREPPAPVVERAKRVETTPQWRTTWDEDPTTADELDECTQIEREIAERNLTRKLRTRQLSVTEARAVVAERDLDAAMIDAIVQAYVRRGYLDDRALADQLVRAAVERKGQGRRVIAQTLAKRRIPRDVGDAALAELPDDDAERALDFARQKARAMRGLEHDVALRRLVGQLARRGYGAAALDAARQALAEL